MPNSTELTVNVRVNLEQIEKQIAKLNGELAMIDGASRRAWDVRNKYLDGSKYEFFLMDECQYDLFLLYIYKYFSLKSIEVRKHKSITREGYLLVEVYI